MLQNPASYQHAIPICSSEVQVALNQLVLGPIVTTVVFTWNLMLQQQSSQLPGKLKRDLVPTMVNGKLYVRP